MRGEEPTCSGCGYPVHINEHAPDCSANQVAEKISQEEAPLKDGVEIVENIEIKGLIETIVSDEKLKAVFDFVNPERVKPEVFERALQTLLEADSVNLTREQREQLFRQTLEYYSKPVDAEKPLLHSTSSYSLRKALEEGFSGGHGSFAGEAGATNNAGEAVQKGLSVTHPDHPSAESFQQLFARLSVKPEELSQFLSVDSQVLTGDSIPKVFVEELFRSMSSDDVRKLIAKRQSVKAEEVDDQLILQLTGPEAQQAFIKDFNSRSYAPNADKIRSEVLPGIEDGALRTTLQLESEHPFPVMLTFEAKDKQEHLTTVSRGEQPTHIPFEDFYWDTLTGEDIREIRVPMNQMYKVRSWLDEKGLSAVSLVPIEVFEVKCVIQSAIEDT